MPVALHRYQVAKLRRTLPWQDRDPPEHELGTTYEIAARNQGKYERVWNGIVRALNDGMLSAVERALRQDYDVISANRVVDQYINEAPIWDKAQNQLENAYLDTIEESALATDKQLEVFRKELRPLELPETQLFVQQQTGRLIKQISDGQRSVINTMVTAGIDDGINPKRLVTGIRNSGIGLLDGRGPYTIQMVQRRRAMLIQEGLRGKKLESAVGRYHKQLLRRRAENIARTEMINAEAAGRNFAWGRAEADGLFVGKNVRRVWIAAGPPRMCPICEALDGETAPIGGSYDGFDRPPAHPSCRCSEGLRVGRA
jgi:hypothetical protein